MMNMPTFYQEQGQSMAWTAVLFAFVLVPLLIFVVDGTRLFRVRSHLQTAVDAACEDAAWSAADRKQFRENGTTTYENNWHTWSVAHTTFQNILVDQSVMQYYPTMRVFPDFSNALMSCDAQAGVPLLIRGGAVNISVSSVSQIRYRR
jgi:hypothetical protein